MTLVHDVDYNGQQDSLRINKLQVDSKFLHFEGSGSFSQLSTNPSMKSQGKLLLNMPKLQEFLKGLLPEGLATKGEGELIFSVEGRLRSHRERSIVRSWNGQGSLFLDSIEYQGFGSIQKLHSTRLLLDKGIVLFTLECLLNNGPSQFQGTLDLSRKKPAFKIDLKGKDVQVSQDLKILGYIIPILITSSSGHLSGKGNFSVKASWQGTDWNKEVSRNITGKGTLSLNDGFLQSKDVLSLILSSFGKPETLQFDQIMTAFRLADGKVYNDNIRVNGKSLKLGLKGWTSLAYDPSRKGNPMDYTVTGDFFKQFLGKDAQKVLSFLGGGKLTTVPVDIAGTVQKPKVSIKMPKVEDLFRSLFSPPKERK